MGLAVLNGTDIDCSLRRAILGYCLSYFRSTTAGWLGWLTPAGMGPGAWLVSGTEAGPGAEVDVGPVADVGAVAKVVGLCVLL